MIRWRNLYVLALVAALMVVGTGSFTGTHATGDYFEVTLEGLEGGTADAINNRRQVAGTVPAEDGPAGCKVAAVWDRGEVTVLDVEGASTPACVSTTDINHHGEVVGNMAEPPWDAFRWRSGETTILSGWGFAHFANAVNDRGVVAGGYADEGLAGGPRALLWEDGAAAELGTLEVEPGSFENSASGALGINRKSQVVGWSAAGDGDIHAFLWDGQMVDLGTLGGSYSVAVDINDRGQVVGTSSTGDETVRAFLWQAEVMTSLGEWTPVAINRFGDVVGNRAGTVVLWDGSTLIEVGAGTASDLNDRGDIVGTSDGSPVMWRPCHRGAARFCP